MFEVVRHVWRPGWTGFVLLSANFGTWKPDYRRLLRCQGVHSSAHDAPSQVPQLYQRLRREVYRLFGLFAQRTPDRGWLDALAQNFPTTVQIGSCCSRDVLGTRAIVTHVALVLARYRVRSCPRGRFPGRHAEPEIVCRISRRALGVCEACPNGELLAVDAISQVRRRREDRRAQGHKHCGCRGALCVRIVLMAWPDKPGPRPSAGTFCSCLLGQARFCSLSGSHLSVFNVGHDVLLCVREFPMVLVHESSYRF